MKPVVLKALEKLKKVWIVKIEIKQKVEEICMSYEQDLYICFGIKYDKDSYTEVSNKKRFFDPNVPPTKPNGGLWASPYKPNGNYVSDWHSFMMTCLSREIFEDKINGISTIFKLSQDAKILYIRDTEDIKLVFPDGQQEEEGNLPVKQIPIGKDILPELRGRLYIDFEKLKLTYDAIYVSKDVIGRLQKFLEDFEEFVLDRQGVLSKDEELMYGESVMKAQLFEDWHVESLLVLNKSTIEVVEYI